MNELTVKVPEGKDYGHIAFLNEMQKDFKLDNLDYRIIHRIVYDNKTPIAYGIVRKLAEAVIIVNSKVPEITRARAMRELMKYAESASKMEKCDQLHCFVSNPHLAQMLEKQYGFVRSKDIVLVKNL